MLFLSIGILILCLLCQVISDCIPPSPPPPEEKPIVILTNSKNQKTTEFAVLDVVFGSFSRLLPDTRYEILVVRSDGKEISNSSFTSDRRGIIPTVALWWDVGVEYPKSRIGKLNLGMLFQYTYSCRIKRDKKMVVEIPIRIKPIEETGPIIYSSNENGEPLNGFVHKKENVYLSGMNFPSGCKLQIYVVRNRYTWEFGNRLDSVLNKVLFLQLDEGQRAFTRLVWASDSTEIGSYDLIVEYAMQDSIFSNEDLADNIYGVGFTVFWLAPPSPPAPSPSHIETDLACQAPPQDPNTGTVIGAPNPSYKDYFAPEEEVWVAVNPHAGGHDYVGKNARLYVVNHKLEADWIDETALTDVSTDGYETTTIQPGCANVNYTKVWCNPTIREEGYDVVVDFAPFGVYNKGTDIVDKLNAKGFIVPTLWVCLESISLNHNSTSSASDALNIRKNYTQSVVIPEWQKAKKCYPAAYIKNKNITVKAVFSAATGVNSAQIRATVESGLLGIINQKIISFSGGTSGQVSFQVANPTPNEVKYFYQKWNWYCGDINGSGSLDVYIGSSQNKIFVILAEPPAPWTTSGQSQPWEDVLWKSCWWAYGETTLEGAAEEIQHHLYNDLGGSYDYGPQYTSWTTGDFNMSSFLNNIPSIGIVNCYDMGKSLVSFSNIIGCGLTYKLSMPFGSLNCEKAIGKGWNCSEGFGNHGFGNISDKVFDACLKVDTDSDPASGPPYTETWMTNEPWSSYVTKVIKSGLPGNPVPYNFNIK
jgi:hypothetical protein